MADKMKKTGLTKAKEIKENTKLILESPSNANLLVDIIEISETENVDILFAFIKSTHKLFNSFFKDKKVVKKKSVQIDEDGEKEDVSENQESPEDVFGFWLFEKYVIVVKRLLELLKHEIDDIRELSLCTLMKFLVAEHNGLIAEKKMLFPSTLYDKILGELLSDAYDMTSLIERFGEYLDYDDIRYFTLKNLNKLFQFRQVINPLLVKNTYALLKLVKMSSSDENVKTFLVLSDKSNEKSDTKAKSDVFALKSHKNEFTKAWLAFLDLKLNSDIHKNVLLQLHTNIMPYMTDPKLLMDFLTDSYDSGGALSLLALNGLFILIQKHNLDYPDFYKKLYALLQPGIFHVKYQSRFFHLLDLFLTSTHLPSYLVAAFCKRLAQLALSAPPQGIILAVMFVKNLMKRHPSCQVLIHKKEVSKLLLEEEQQHNEEDLPSIDPSSDPFDPKEPDPAKCNAIQSSLWELKTLESHFFPKMPSLIETFNKPLDKNEVDIAKFFDVSFDDMFEKHLVKVTDSNAVLEYQTPRGFLGGEMSELWSF